MRRLCASSGRLMFERLDRNGTHNRCHTCNNGSGGSAPAADSAYAAQTNSTCDRQRNYRRVPGTTNRRIDDARTSMNDAIPGVAAYDDRNIQQASEDAEASAHEKSEVHGRHRPERGSNGSHAVDSDHVCFRHALAKWYERSIVFRIPPALQRIHCLELQDYQAMGSPIAFKHFSISQSHQCTTTVLLKNW